MRSLRQILSSDIRKVKNKNSKKIQVAYASLFHFNSSNEETWGIEDPEDFNLVKAKIKEHQQKSGREYDSVKLEAVNNKLNYYSRDGRGVNNMLEDALDDKGISEIQNKVLQSTLLQISRSGDANEAQAINATVEYEVINSGISENDKALILSVNSVFAHSFKTQLSRLPNSEAKGTIYKKAVQVVIIIVAAAAIGAIAGGVVGAISCCLGSYNSCNWDCVGTYIWNGALVGATLGLVAIE